MVRAPSVTAEKIVLTLAGAMLRARNSHEAQFIEPSIGAGAPGRLGDARALPALHTGGTVRVRLAACGGRDRDRDRGARLVEHLVRGRRDRVAAVGERRGGREFVWRGRVRAGGRASMSLLDARECDGDDSRGALDAKTHAITARHTARAPIRNNADTLSRPARHYLTGNPDRPWPVVSACMSLHAI